MNSLEELSKEFDPIVMKSRYRTKCLVCKLNINRNDFITKCVEAKGMKLRAVHYDNNCGYIRFTRNYKIY